MYRNPALYESVRAYVIAAINLITYSQFEKGLINDSSSSFGLEFILSHDKLKLLPEYNQCQKILLSDYTISSQIDVLIGIADFGYLSPDAEIVMTRLPNLGIYRDNIKFNPDHFEREYENFEAAFYDENVTYEVIVPVTGSLINRSVKLADNLEICLLTRKDLTLALPEDYEPRLFELIWAIRAQYTLPKVVGSRQKSEWEASKKNELLRNAANAVIDSVIACLRLFNISNVSPIANIHRTKSFIFHHDRQFMVRSAPNTSFNLVFDGDISSEFVNFWTEFQRVIKKYKFIDIAARRFSFTFERQNQEDQIIDLLIAAEALFLSQTKKRVTRISESLSERAADFLGVNESFRNQVKKDFKSVYKLRNMIVHGNSQLNCEIKKIEAEEKPLFGEELKFDQFIYRIISHIQSSILKMIGVAEAKKDKAQSNKLLIDWDSLAKNK